VTNATAGRLDDEIRNFLIVGVVVARPVAKDFSRQM
jgi:hypothetical protein